MTLNMAEEYARFAEDARLGWLELVGSKDSAKFNDRDLSLPVFNFGFVEAIPSADVTAAIDAVRDGSLRLPFPECVYMYNFPPNHSASLQPYGTVWIVVLQQTETEIVGNLFFRHPGKMQHFGVNAYQFVATLDTLELCRDPRVAQHSDQRLEKMVKYSAESRALTCITHSHLLARQPQAVQSSMVLDTKKVAAINRRRGGQYLSGLMPVRIIRLDETRFLRTRPTAPAAPRSEAERSPHWRRGHWRNYQSGKSVWVRASAIHGGADGKAPPWYNVI